MFAADLMSEGDSLIPNNGYHYPTFTKGDVIQGLQHEFITTLHRIIELIMGFVTNRNDCNQSSVLHPCIRVASQNSSIIKNR